jgi:hypothetical protein
MQSVKNIGKFRLAVSSHCDIVTSEVDFYIEQELQVNCEDEIEQSAINAKRNVYLKEIKEAEASNLKHLNEELASDLTFFSESNEQAQSERLFKTFCFTIEYKNSFRLVVTDIYLSERQLKIFKSLIFYNYPANTVLNYSADLDFYADIFDLRVNKVG